jgi:hypothetical protein
MIETIFFMIYHLSSHFDLPCGADYLGMRLIMIILFALGALATRCLKHFEVTTFVQYAGEAHLLCSNKCAGEAHLLCSNKCAGEAHLLCSNKCAGEAHLLCSKTAFG